jgi:hypothetical protein
VLAASIFALMMEAASTSVTSVNFYETTLGNIPKDGNFHEVFVLLRIAVWKYK